MKSSTNQNPKYPAIEGIKRKGNKFSKAKVAYKGRVTQTIILYAIVAQL